MALLLETGLGLFGLFGIGWIYVGEGSRGLKMLIAGIVGWIVLDLLGILTGGALCCALPFVFPPTAVVSALFLNTYMNQHPESFGVKATKA